MTISMHGQKYWRHATGDLLLKGLAELIINNVRESDTVARYGGEEFVILAPRTSLNEGEKLAHKLKNLISENIFYINQVELQITASFGVSLVQLSGNEGFENYFTMADKALYLAKRQGKNRVKKII